MSSHPPISLQELKLMRRPLWSVNTKHKEHLSRLEKSALFVTEHVGTMGFFLLIAAWTALWIGWNTFAMPQLRFDPFPAFVFWLFISNMIQIFLMPLIMVGQNLQGKHSEARAEADFEVNVRAEREIETILQHLENQSDVMLKILRALEKKD